MKKYLGKTVRLLTVSGFVISTGTVFAQSPINAFLLQAQSEASPQIVIGVNDQTRGLHRWINEAELRVSGETDQQTYGLRVQPKMPSQIEAENAILSLRHKQRSLDSQLALNDGLKLQYDQWLMLEEQKSRVELATSKLNLTEKAVRYQRSLVETESFNAKALLDAELSYSRQLEQSRVHHQRLKSLQQTLGLTASDMSLVSIDQMLKMTSSTSDKNSSAASRTAQLKLDIALQQQQREKAQRGLGLNLMGIQVDHDRNDSKLGFTLGLRLPLGGNSFDSVARIHDVLESTDELYRKEATEQRAAISRRALLDWQRGEEMAIHATLADIKQRIARIGDSDNVAVYLMLQQQELEADERLAAVRHRALQYYIDYLHLTGQLAQPPLRNWALAGLPVL